MAQAAQLNDTRTSVDDIFDLLRNEILSLKLRPGDKLSEVDMAARFGVSRQPVRDAFSRLANQDLLVIRPKRATMVKRFSTREINKSRFVRSSIEERVLRRASDLCDLVGAARLDMALAEQEEAAANKDIETFGKLDYAFHKTLCEIAKVDFAFDVILAEKTKVDRLCALGLEKEDRMHELIADHYEIAKAVEAHDAERAVKAGMKHLGRLDETIERISAQNADYFDPE
ncbi:MAG: GntR family transcriptional regulator [Rhizobiaceae bacterium]|nr:GntR family transcriptional regulator [Rhizobiaceae bacterium]